MYNNDVYRGDVFRGDVFRGDVFRGDVFRGDVFYVDRFGNHSAGYSCVIDGSKQGRPAVVVSDDALNSKLDVVEVVYLTTKDTTEELPTHAPVMARMPSTAICEQITTVAKDRLRDWVRRCTEDEMQQIDAALLRSLGVVWDNDLLKRAQEALDHMRQVICEKDAENAKLKEECAALMERPAPVMESADVARLTAERDIYKAQYEMLLNKMIG